eukprot:GHVU01003020.1.p1 GENE.GHVU01003020.1~~GHVU01003020.1.p1  ORF type:complete len:854 (-),score=104.12 GHVU01003020.1:472-2895(-)
MPPPVTGDQLYQFYCAAGWMRNHIPNFAKLTMPLLDSLLAVKQAAGSALKIKCKKIRLTEAVRWNAAARQAFEATKIAIANQVQLSHPDDTKEILVCTDASDFGWGGIITMVDEQEWRGLLKEAGAPPDDGKEHTAHIAPDVRHIADLNHQPLAFISGEFKGAQLRWSTPEHEAYAVVSTLQRYRHICYRPKGVIVLTDHGNLAFLLNTAPSSKLPPIAVRKMHRWYCEIMSLPYRIRYIPGEHNDWADMLSRMTPTAAIGADTHTARAVCLVPKLPHPEPGSVSPVTLQELKRAQSRTKSPQPKRGRVDEEGLIHIQLDDEDTMACPYWVPEDCTKLQLRILVLVHCMDGIHTSQDGTLTLLRRHFKWRTMLDDGRQFVRECLHCLRGSNDKSVPRPLGTTLVAQRPYEVLHADYLFVDKATSGEQYILVIKDGFSGFAWLVPTRACGGDPVVEALTRWSLAYRPPTWLVSDGGSHFDCEAVATTLNQQGITHHVTTANCPWANGTVENLCGRVLRIMRTLRSGDVSGRNADWLPRLPWVQQRINSTPYKGKNYTPQQCILGPAAVDDGTAALHYRPPKVPALDAVPEADWDALITAWADLHERHRSEVEEARKKGATSNFPLPVFQRGAYVLVARLAHKKGQKLSPVWIGPSQVQGPATVMGKPSSFIFSVKDLLTGKVSKQHVKRLRHYAPEDRTTEAAMKQAASSLQEEYAVEGLRSLRLDGLDWKVLVKWQDYDEDECTDEPLEIIAADQPDLLLSLLRARKERLPKEVVEMVKQALPRGKRSALAAIPSCVQAITRGRKAV